VDSLTSTTHCNTSKSSINREDFGLRWQSAAATPLFGYGQSFQSGVALRFPPQSKKNGVRLRRTAPLRETLHQ